MENSTLYFVNKKIGRLGHGCTNNPSFRETIAHNLTPFVEPVNETVNGVDYQIIAGFFNIFFTYLIYYCPETEKYLYYGCGRDDLTIPYKEDFLERTPTFSTFNEAEEYIYGELKNIYGE